MDPLTEYCTRCGKSAEMIVDYRFECHGGANIVAISHIIAQRKMRVLMANVSYGGIDLNSNPFWLHP